MNIPDLIYIFFLQDPRLLASQSNEILTAIVQGMRKEEPSNRVKLAATKALLNSLEFTKANFEKEVCTLSLSLYLYLSLSTSSFPSSLSLYYLLPDSSLLFPLIHVSLHPSHFTLSHLILLG